MSHSDDPFASAVHTARAWVRAVADGLDTDDRAFAYRVLRAWMHTIRDRISVTGSAHLSAQLPEILRGVYYEGWVPGHVPVRHGRSEFVTQFARAADIDPDEVGPVAGAVTAALSDLFAPGQLNRVFAVLPMHLYGVLCGGRTPIADAPSAQLSHGEDPPIDRFTALENRVRALGDAVAALAHGLERLPIDASNANRTAAAAQEAHRILLTEGPVHTAAQAR
ncbi:DUF2267 domain-containing protein [Nocardia sp. NPDC049707]|uniref:DUF2267 domain-containing protein n=1 Tax=Nocardia sp. NPDC049707 TaxID=3154735 RepID=UPI00343A9CB6